MGLLGLQGSGFGGGLRAFGGRRGLKGCEVQGFGKDLGPFGLRVSGSGFRVQGLGFRVSGSGFGRIGEQSSRWILAYRNRNHGLKARV